MKKIIILLSIVALTAIKTSAQISNYTVGRISVINKNWQKGGTFEDKLPHDEILEKRTEYTKKFQRNDSQVDIIIGGPFHYKDASGAWQDINLNLKTENSAKFKYSNGQNKFISQFAENATDGVKMEYKNNTIYLGINPQISSGNWMPSYSANKDVLLNENTIAYKNIYEGIDLDYELTTNAILHKLKFKNRSIFSEITSQQNVNIDEEIILPHNSILYDSLGVLNSNRTTKGAVYVVLNNDTVFTIIPSRIWDASFKGDVFNPADDNRNISDGFKFIQTGITWLSTDKIKLTAYIPTNWLLSVNRLYPIVFDPTITIGGTGAHMDYLGFAFRYPWRTNFWQQVSQSLYWQPDIDVAGNITAIAYRQAVNNGRSNNNARVQMQTTSASTFPFPTSFITSGWTTCYNNGTLNYTSGSGASESSPSPIWRTINLTTPFFYDNVKNLVVETRFQNPTWTSGGAWYHYERNGSTVLVHGTCDCTSSYPLPLNNQVRYSYLTPVVRLTIQTTIPCISPANPPNPTSNSPQCNSVTLTRSGTPPAGITWYWQTSATGTSTANSGTTYVVNTSGTYYLRAYNSANGGCWSTGSGSRAVVVNQAPSVTASSNSPITAPASLNLNATAITGATYSWSNNVDNWTSIVRNPTRTNTTVAMSGNYCVTTTLNGCNSSPSCTQVTINGSGCTPPSTPTGLTGTAISSSQINLSWNSVPGATSYDVFLCGGTFLENVITNSYSHIGLMANTTYYYEITAKGPGCSSAPTSCYNVTTKSGSCTPPAVPTGLQQASSTISSITLSWNTSVNAQSYIIRNCNSGATYNTASSPYMVTGLNAGTNYTYQILAVGTGCNSTYSSCVTANTITGPCTAPTSPTGATATQLTMTAGQTTTLQVVDGVLNSAPNWVWYIGNCGGTQIGTGATLPVSPTTTTTYSVRASACATNTTCRSVTINVSAFTLPSITIDYTNSIIPPWQREGDFYFGDIAVTINNSQDNRWNLFIDVYESNGTYVESIFYPERTGKIHFSTITTFLSLPQDHRLKELSTNGRKMVYGAMLYSNPSIKAYDQRAETKIIESKWDKVNYVYYNDPSSTDKIRIPIKWINNFSPVKVEVKRNGLVAATLSPFVLIPGSIKRYKNENEFNNGNFNIDFNTGYCIIDKSNSNIDNTRLLPGDFEYVVYYSNNNIEQPLDFGVFDLTKIGRISERTTVKNSPSQNIIVMVGGILHEIESSVDNLIKYDDDVTSKPNSTFSYSVLEYCRYNSGNTKYATWYIAQGNANSVRRNAYDIGIALERIYYLNNLSLNGIRTKEINILCHSKGGLDTRAMLAGNNIFFSSSLKGSSFDFNNSILYGKVKKIAFIATPHRGASSIIGLLSTYIGSLMPGVMDLIPNSLITRSLNQQKIPHGIQFLNLTGYGKVQLNFFYGLSDGVVNITDSHKPEPFSIDGNLIQLYQNDLRHFCQNSSCTGLKPLSRIGGMFHMQVHKSVFLNWTGPDNYNVYNCTPILPVLPANSNLEKIKKFLNDETSSIQSCKNDLYQYIGVTSGSILSGAHVSMYSSDYIDYLGTTDENGAFNLELLSPLSKSDSLNISSLGYDSLLIPVNDEMINSRKMSIAAIKSNIISNKVQSPNLSLVSQNPVTASSDIQIKVTAKNVTQLLINYHNSDSVFVPLNLNNNIASIPLDTGYNRIIVKFIGIDTAVQIKEVYYLPDSLMNYFAMDLTINTTPLYINSKMFVNSIFYKDIKSLNTDIKLLKGINQIKFSKVGYKDSLFVVDTTVSMQLALQPYSYSSRTDSSIIDFSNGLNPQYWRTITLKNTSAANNIKVSTKQYDDTFSGMGLKPQTRKFVFKNLTSSNAKLRTAIALDQINTPDKDSVYLLTIRNGQYEKYLANQAALTEYDPEVQKLAFDSISLGANQTQEIVLMKKQAPVMKNFDTIIHAGETLSFPLNLFASDPDSIKNDITLSSTDAKVLINGSLVSITAPAGFIGNTTYSLTATHDFIDVRKTYNLKVIPPDVFVPTAFTPNKNGLNDILKPAFMGKLVNCHFTIFNRNGNKVFETKECLTGWDGKIKGKEQQTGVFVWILTYQFEGEEKKEQKGTVTLIR